MKHDIAIKIVGGVFIFGIIVFIICANFLRNTVNQLVANKKIKKNKKTKSSSRKS
jgi:uncharacterized membrane protein